MLEDLKKKIEYTIELGVLVDKTTRTRKSMGVTNAELMYIHEYGSPLRHIPARPVLAMTIEHAHEILPEITKKALNIYLTDGEKALEKELNRFSVRLANYAKDIIYLNDGRLKPNAPSTIRAKGFDHPLFQTGQLARSISSRVLNDKGEQV